MDSHVTWLEPRVLNMDDGKRTKGLVAAKARPVGETDATAEELPRLDRESADFLPFLVDSLPVLVSFVDAQGRYRFINKTYEDWFGHSRAEVIGQSVRRVLGEEAYAVVEDKVTTALSGQEVHYESQVPFRDGGRRHVDAYYYDSAT